MVCGDFLNGTLWFGFPSVQSEWLICFSPWVALVYSLRWRDIGRNSRAPGKAALAQTSHIIQALIKSLCYFGWTGRCCLYPLVIWCNCWWLRTVSFTIDPSFLQLKAPSTQNGSHFLGWPTACSYRWVKGLPSALKVNKRYSLSHLPWPGCCQVFSASAQGDSHPEGSR